MVYNFNHWDLWLWIILQLQSRNTKDDKNKGLKNSNFGRSFLMKTLAWFIKIWGFIEQNTVTSSRDIEKVGIDKVALNIHSLLCTFPLLTSLSYLFYYQVWIYFYTVCAWSSIFLPGKNILWIGKTGFCPFVCWFCLLIRVHFCLSC